MARGPFGVINRQIVRRLPPQIRRRIGLALPRGVAEWLRRRRTDVFLVSFPKCGRTWLRVMIGRALQLHHGLPDGVGIVELHRLAEQAPGVPSILATHDGFDDDKNPDDFDASKRAYRGARVILLVRDPRDVIVSFYHHRRARQLTAELDEFLARPAGSFATLLGFYDSWASALHVPAETLVVRYEDLHTGPDRELRRVLDVVGVEVSDEVVDAAVAYGSFDNMRQLEEADALGSDRLRPRRPGDFSTYKTRRGAVAGFRDELTPEQIDRLNEMMRGTQIHRFGYQPD